MLEKPPSLMGDPGSCSSLVPPPAGSSPRSPGGGVRKGPEFLQGWQLDGWLMLEPLWPRPRCGANLPGAVTAHGKAYFGNPWDQDELSITCEPFLEQEGGNASTSGTCCSPEASPVVTGIQDSSLGWENSIFWMIPAFQPGLQQAEAASCWALCE